MSNKSIWKILRFSIALALVIIASAQSANAISATLSVSPNPVQAGVAMTITVTGYDNQDIQSLSAWFGGTYSEAGSWHTYLCEGVQKSCSHSWTYIEKKPGTYEYWGGAYDNENNLAWSDPVYVTVEESQTSDIEIKFTGTVTKYKTYSNGECHGWEIALDKLIKEPPGWPCWHIGENILPINFCLKYCDGPYGEIDFNIREGDEVEVYGRWIDCFVVLCGSNAYYLRKVTPSATSCSIDISNDKSIYYEGDYSTTTIRFYADNKLTDPSSMTITLHHPQGTFDVTSYYTKISTGTYQRGGTVEDAGTRTIEVTATINRCEAHASQSCEVLEKPTSEEIKFIGTAIEYQCLIGDCHWTVSVDNVISGPQPSTNQIEVITWSSNPPGPPWGYVDPNIKKGDKVEVYGVYCERWENIPYVNLEGSEDYYIKRWDCGKILDYAISDSTYSLPQTVMASMKYTSNMGSPTKFKGVFLVRNQRTGMIYSSSKEQLTAAYGEDRFGYGKGNSLQIRFEDEEAYIGVYDAKLELRNYNTDKLCDETEWKTNQFKIEDDGAKQYTFQSTDNAVPIEISGTLQSSPYTASYTSGNVPTVNALSEYTAQPDCLKYVFTGWTGPITEAGTLLPPILSPGTYTANYKKQYYLTVNTEPSDIATISGQGWYDQGTIVTTGQAPKEVTVDGKEYQFKTWKVDGSSVATSFDYLQLTLDYCHTATASYQEESTEGAKVLIDHAHGAGQISEAKVENQGFSADALSVFPLDTLNNYDVVLIDTPSKAYTSTEIQKITDFVRNGGGLLVANDWGSAGTVTNTVNPILQNFDISAVNKNTGWGPYRKSNGQLKDHEITHGLNAVHAGKVSRLDVPESTSILIQETYVIAAAAFYDAGKVVVLGDNDLIDSDWGYDNAKFLKNILTWLSTKKPDSDLIKKWDKNGHYYELIKKDVDCNEAREYAEKQEFEKAGVVYKGYLATLTSPEENAWVVENLITPTGKGNVYPWLGGYQLEGYNNPSEGWKWVTGEDWSWTNWNEGEPNDVDGYNERYLKMYPSGKWNDESCDGEPGWENYVLIEYEPVSGDCFESVPSDHWKGEYYNNMNLDGSPSMVRDDGTGHLSFDWGYDSPSTSCGINSDFFSVRWSRSMYFDSGTWHFTATTDDGMRLYVDDDRVIDKWFNQAPTTYTADKDLTAGSHTIKVEYYEHDQTAVAKLGWEELPPTELPDLTLSPDDITFSNPNPNEGEMVTITATIHNKGDADANNVKVQFFRFLNHDDQSVNSYDFGQHVTGQTYLSPSEIENVNNGLLGPFWAIYYSWPFGEELGKTTAPGIAYSIIESIGQVPGLDKYVEMIKQTPWYRAGELALDATAHAAVAYKMYEEAQKYGGEPTRGMWLKYERWGTGSGSWSSGSIPYGDLSLIGEDTINSIDAGKDETLNINWEVASPTYIFVKVDPANSIKELNENNNVALKEISVNERKFIILGLSPIDFEVMDPHGLTITKKLIEVPDAAYMESDINDDGDLEDIIFIPDQKIGDYQITVIPEPDAEDTDTYTLEVSTGDTTTVLAENVPVSEIPTEPYIFKSDMNQPIDPSPLINGIDSICALGVPGPLLALNTAPVPVAAGDDDTTPVPSVVVMASGLGNGRVVAFSGGFFTNEAINLYDNKRFGNNVIDWLDKLGKKKVLITRGHREWDGGTNYDNFKAELESRGYTVTRFSGTVAPSVLSDVGVVIIGTAWGTVLQSEIDALTNFVTNGGGLFLIGLGWSWEPYNPGFTLDDYPMNKIAEPYGIRWIDGYIIDPTNNYDGHPIFHTFYPNIEVQTIYQAFSYIETTTNAHPVNLPSFLQINETVRRKYTNAHLLIATATRELKQTSPQRQEIYDFYKNLINTYPQYFGKGVVYDKTTESTMAWIRERAYRSFIDALPLTEVRKSEIASTIGLSGRYLDIWNDFTVLLLDNTCLNEKQKDFIHSYLSLLPKGIHNLRSISVMDYLGHTSPEVPLWGLEGSVNIFGGDIGGCSENSFPVDVPPGIVDGFCIVVAHEVNHVVDAFFVSQNETHNARKKDLIDDAGVTKNNYLRSMDGFCNYPGLTDEVKARYCNASDIGNCDFCFPIFQWAPQEFFASISNQWFTDSKKTIELGLVRFDKGYRHPINQALFFADVYSLGRNFTYFYTIDTQGNITRQMILLSRDVNGRINSLTIDEQVYTFALNANGDVTAYSIQPITSQRILFDESHHQFWTACIDAGLVDFANELRKRDYQVDRFTDGPITTDILSQYEVFVLPGGFIGKYTFDEGPKLLSADEIIALRNFVDNGGGLFLLGCGWSWADYTNLSIDINPVNQIGCEFGIKVNDDIVHDPTDHRPNGEGNPIFHEPLIKYHPITQGVHNISACEGLVSSLSIVEPASVEIIVTGDEDSYSGYRLGYYNAGEYPPVVAVAEYGKGRVAFVTQEGFFTSMDDDKNGVINLCEYDNRNLAFNIIDWLAHKF